MSKIMPEDVSKEARLKADNETKRRITRAAAGVGFALLFQNADREAVRLQIKTMLTRVENGNYFNCEMCNGSMPIFITDPTKFLRTTCCDSCEEKLQLAKSNNREETLQEVNEEKITWEAFESSSIFKDLLPEHLRITTNLNVRQYDGAKVTIFAADMEDVERLGIHALVSISHNSDTLPMKIRIAAFAENEQFAILTSLTEGIPLGEAKTLIRREFMQKTAYAKMASGKFN